MRPLSQALRLIYINAVLVRHGIDRVILGAYLFRSIRFLLYLLPWNWLKRPQGSSAVRIRRALTDLGPLFVKFGQIVSTRPDLLPDDLIVELSKLQDRVEPFPGREARLLVEKAYGKPVSEIFKFFDETPLASASIAQVHAAKLKDNTEVIVKVVRPNIETVIRRDVSLLHAIADLAEHLWPQSRRFRPSAVVDEFERTILDELDMLRESASASQLRRNFQGSDLLYVPEISWPHTRQNILVAERISGIPISDIAELRRCGINLKALAERGVDIFFTQVFQHNFFHADMHPGNIFVSPKNPEVPTYVAVDFGIMGSLTPDDQRYLAENLLAFFNRDYQRVAQLHISSKWISEETRVDEFEAAIRAVCEPIFERPLKDISFGMLLVRLFRTARRYNMEVQPQLVLLQKTLLNVEGLGRQLYPELNLWQTAKPFLERWVIKHAGSASILREWQKNAPKLGESLPLLPSLAYEVLRQAQGGELSVRFGEKELKAIRCEIKSSNRRLIYTLVGSIFLVGSTIIYATDIGSTFTFWRDVPMVSWFFAVAGLYLLWKGWPSKGDD